MVDLFGEGGEHAPGSVEGADVAGAGVAVADTDRRALTHMVSEHEEA